MESIKLNIGCGRNVQDGFINLDNSPSVLANRIPGLKWVLFKTAIISEDNYEMSWSKNVKWHDARKGLAYQPESVDKIYSSHFLEHIEQNHGEFLIKECYRCLKKGGIFRLVVPDLEYHVMRYMKNLDATKRLSREPHDQLLHNLQGAYLQKKRAGANHCYMYDWATLKILLEDAGFSSVRKRGFQESSDQDLAKLDNRPEDSLHIDALK